MVPVFGLKCPQACPERAVGALADDSLIPMIGVISVVTAVTMRMTATASARGAVEAGEKMVSLFWDAWLFHFNVYLSIFLLHLSFFRLGSDRYFYFFVLSQVPISVSISLKVQVPWTPLPISVTQP